MTRFLLFTTLTTCFLYSAGISAQKLETENYHNHRNLLENSYLKFYKEKQGRVVFLGGSITFNPGWRDSVCQYLSETFPETTFDFINAGIPSMGSTPGAFRFERDVLKNGAVDLLFIEAAVNDDTNRRTPQEIIRGMEGIVRHALTANPFCDMVMMHFVDEGKMDDYRTGKIPEIIHLHEAVASHYGISSINLAKEVTDRIDAGEFTWENDFKNLHPSPFGQKVYYHSMIQFLEQAWQQAMQTEGSARYNMPIQLDMYAYTHGLLVEPIPKQVRDGWHIEENWQPDYPAGTRANYVNVPMLVGTHPGEIIKFNFYGSAVGIAVAAGPDAGIISYRIDCGPWRTQDLFTRWSSQLYLPWFFTLAGDLEYKNHVLQIRVIESRHPESRGNKCVLRYFYYNAK